MAALGLTLGVAGLPAFSFAEDPAPPPLVQPAQFTLTVSPQEANSIGDSILKAKGAMTPEDALALLQKIRGQVQQQLAADAKKQEPADKKEPAAPPEPKP